MTDIQENNGQSVTERAEEPDDQQEMFPAGIATGDKKRTLGNLVRPNQSNALEAEMTKHRVDLRDGLLDPDQLYRYAVTCRPGKVVEVPHREKQPDGEMKVNSWTTVQFLAPVYMEPLGMGEEAVTKAFHELLLIDATRAAKSLEALQAEFADYMRSGIQPT